MLVASGPIFFGRFESQTPDPTKKHPSSDGCFFYDSMSRKDCDYGAFMLGDVVPFGFRRANRARRSARRRLRREISLGFS